MRALLLTTLISLVAGANPARAQVPSGVAKAAAWMTPPCTLILASSQGIPGSSTHSYVFHGICTPQAGEPFWVDGKAGWIGAEFRATEELTINEGQGGTRSLMLKCLKSDPWLPVSQGKYDFTGCIFLSDASSAAAFPKGSPPLPGFAGVDLAASAGTGRVSGATGPSQATTSRLGGTRQPVARTPAGPIKMSDQPKAPNAQNAVPLDSIPATLGLINCTWCPNFGGGSISVLQGAAPRQVRAGSEVALAGGMRLSFPAAGGAAIQLLSGGGRVLKTFPAGAELRQTPTGLVAVVAGGIVYPIPRLQSP